MQGWGEGGGEGRELLEQGHLLGLIQYYVVDFNN